MKKYGASNIKGRRDVKRKRRVNSIHKYYYLEGLDLKDFLREFNKNLNSYDTESVLDNINFLYPSLALNVFVNFVKNKSPFVIKGSRSKRDGFLFC